MVKANKISQTAKTNLIRQQLALVDLIEEETRESDRGWASLFCSIALKCDSLQIIEHFRDCVFHGITPSARILGDVAEMFDRYLADEPSILSLDESFKLKSKTNHGRPVKQREHRIKDDAIFTLMWAIRKRGALLGKTISLESAAGTVINRMDLKASEGSLKKKYINAGAQQRYDSLFSQLPLQLDSVSEETFFQGLEECDDQVSMFKLRLDKKETRIRPNSAEVRIKEKEIIKQLLVSKLKVRE